MAATEYAIGTYEINLLHEDDLNATFNALQEVCQWVDTAINYDNDYLLPSVLNEQTKIITKISSCHYDDYELFVSNHLKCLKRDQVDLMLVHSDRGDWSELIKRIAIDSRFIHTGVSNFTAQDMQKYYDITGQWPYANELEINPYYVDLEAIEFCKQHGIKVIAYAILGGKYNSWQTVAQFGLGNLIAFAQKFADIIIVRANSKTEAKHFAQNIKHFDFAHAVAIEPFSKMTKSIEPMQYTSPVVYNQFLGRPTYLRECEVNNSKSLEIKSATLLDTKLPDAEMLGDYKVFLRYKLNPEDQNPYIGDWLNSKDYKSLYAIYLWDKNNKLTKVVPDATRVEVWQYTIGSKQ